MRHRSLGWIMISAWISAWPIAAHADHLSNARDAMRKGDLKVAQIELRNAVRADPQNAEAHYWLGCVAFELGDPVAAEREAVAARDRGYDPRQAARLLSQALLRQNKFDQLLDTLKPDGKDPSLDASILVSRGYALLGLKRPDDARQAFAQAEQAAPNAVEPLLASARLAMARADLTGAQAKIDRAVAAQPKSAEALLAKAQLLRLKSDVPGAVAVLDALIIDQPSVTQARLDRAGLELGLGKTDAARLDIDSVLKSAPGNVQAIYLQAVTLAQAKNYKAADADLDRLSAYLGRIPRAYFLQAVVKEQLGQIEQAEDAARKYLGRSPDDLAAYKMLAQLQFDRHRPDLAIDTLDTLADNGKADAGCFDLLGRAYAATGRGPEAIGAFQKAEALAPNDVGLQTRIAAVRVSTGDPDAAVGDLEHALVLAPKLPAVGEALFFAALATGDSAKAADALAKIREAEGPTEVVGNLEGLYKLSQIDPQGARATFAEVARNHPDFVPARVNLARVTLMLGDRAQAETMLGDVLAAHPTTEPALSMLAALYRQDDRMPDAVALLERARRSDPNSIRVTVALGDLYIRAEQPQKALDLAAAATQPGGNPITMLGLRAAAEQALGQKQQARDVYGEIVKQDANALGARRQLVALLVDAGDFESARAVVNAGLAANPRTYQLYQDLVAIDLKSGGIDAALATADRLAAQDQNFPAIKALKGDVYTAADRPADAAAAYVAADNAAPSAQLVTRAAGAMRRAGQGEEADALLSRWLAQHPDDRLVGEQAVANSIASGKLDDAMTRLQSLLKQKPHDAMALNNLAWVYQQKGDDARARPLARQAYVLLPGPQTADTLGWILTTSGDAGTGVTLLRQASAETTTDPRILYHYAVALKDTGNQDEARKQLRTVVAAKGAFKEKTEAQKLLDDLTKGT